MYSRVERFCAHSSVILVFISKKHQNNPLVSAETIRHSSTYIILYKLVLGHEYVIQSPSIIGLMHSSMS